MNSKIRVTFLNLASQPCGPSASSVVLSYAVQKYPELSARCPCSFIDALVYREDPESILWRVVAEQPDVLCISCYSWNVAFIEGLVPELLALLPSLRIALGGPGVCLLSKCLPLSVWTCDARQGEVPLVNWLCDLVGLSPREQKPLSHRAYIDRTDNYVTGNSSKSMVVYDASRGCPFSCSFCFDGLPLGVPEHRPGEVIFAELCYLASLGYSVVDVSDNNANRIDRIFEAYIAAARQFPGTVIHTEVRAELFHEGSAREAGDLPNLQMFMGIQSAVDSEVSSLNRRNYLPCVERLFHDWLPLETRKATLGVELMFGLPGQTIRSFGWSFDYAASLKPNKISLYHYQWFPWDKDGARHLRHVLSSEFRCQVGEIDTLTVHDISWCRSFKRVFYSLQTAGEWTSVVNALLSDRGKSPFEFYSGVLEKCENIWSWHDVLTAAMTAASKWLGPETGSVLQEELSDYLGTGPNSLSPLWHRSSALLERCLSRGVVCQ